MNTGGQFARQYVSFFILALFLGLFVSAMAASSSQDALVRLNFDQPFNVTQKVDQQANTVHFVFPGISVAQLSQKNLQPYFPRGILKKVSLGWDADQGGASVVIHLTHNNADIRVFKTEQPYSLVINIGDRLSAFAEKHLHKKVIFCTSASIYRV